MYPSDETSLWQNSHRLCYFIRFSKHRHHCWEQHSDLQYLRLPSTHSPLVHLPGGPGHVCTHHWLLNILHQLQTAHYVDNVLMIHWTVRTECVGKLTGILDEQSPLLLAPNGVVLADGLQDLPFQTFHVFEMIQIALMQIVFLHSNTATTIIMMIINIVIRIWSVTALFYLEVWKCFHLSSVPRWCNLTVERGGRASEEVPLTVTCWWCHCGMRSLQSHGYVPSSL